MKVDITFVDGGIQRFEGVSAFYPCIDLTTTSFMLVTGGGVHLIREVKDFFVAGKQSHLELLKMVADAYNQGPDPKKVRDEMDKVIDFVREAIDDMENYK